MLHSVTDRQYGRGKVGRLAVLCLLTIGSVSTAQAWDGVAFYTPGFDATTLLTRADVPPPVVDYDNTRAVRSAEAGALSPADAWKRANEWSREGRYEEALPLYNVVEAAYPRLADRVAFARANTLLAMGEGTKACTEYNRVVTKSLDSALETQARVGAVRCLIASNSPKAALALTALTRRYAALPNESSLSFELAAMYERLGKPESAVPLYRRIDLTSPGSALGERARRQLTDLSNHGIYVAPYPAQQWVERTERLVAGGPLDAAKSEVNRLLAEKLPAQQHADVLLLAARIARNEGRWEDAKSLLAAARGAGVDDAKEESKAKEAADAAVARQADLAARQISWVTGGRAYDKLVAWKLKNIVEIGARASLKEPVNAALTALAAAKQLPADVAFDAAIRSVGVADDTVVLALFTKLADNPTKIGIASRYHAARTLERLGRTAEAEAEYARVIATDRTENHYYGMWSQQRLAVAKQSSGPICATSSDLGGWPASIPDNKPAELASLSDLVPNPAALARPVSLEGMAIPDAKALAKRDRTVQFQELAMALAPVAEANREGLPWLGRAQDLLLLGDNTAAADELYEAFLAYRDAMGKPVRRAGLEAVYRGEERARRPVTWKDKALRRKLTAADRTKLADIAAAIGDQGTAASYGGIARVLALPRAYEDLVGRVAARHGLDPNLLLAVMRVESVYQRRILSSAGAIGLMQIMPMTGRRIAQRVGMDDFGPDALLDPETNLEFAAWYLASLIERFDGHLPLAIASYNGGPHNVRRWIQMNPENMPLDAFLETIPFTETNRYVRRVLTNYTAYRAQQGLALAPLSLDLPQTKIDPVAF